MKSALYLILVASLLSACGTTATSGESPASTSEEKAYPVSPWGEEATKACVDSVYTVIPYIESSSFEFETGLDAYGDGIINFYLYYETEKEAEKAFTDYTYLCADNMYRVEVGENSSFDPATGQIVVYTLAYADALITENLAIEIAFTVSTRGGLPCLGLFCMTYLYSPEDVFPEVAIKDLLGEDHHVPLIEGDGYLYDFQFFLEEESGKEALQILVSGKADYTLEETYFLALIKEEYDIFKITPEGEATYSIYEYPGIEMGSVFVATREEAQIFFAYDFHGEAFAMEIYPR